MDKTLKYCTVPIDENKSFIFDHVHIAWNEQITFHQHAEPELSYILKGSAPVWWVILLNLSLPEKWFFFLLIYLIPGLLIQTTMMKKERLRILQFCFRHHCLINVSRFFLKPGHTF